MPLISASPSFALQQLESGAMPAARSTLHRRPARAVLGDEELALRRAAPASGARAARDRPTRRPTPGPARTAAGPASWTATSVSMTTGRTRPSGRARGSPPSAPAYSRTTGASSGAPTPTACERIRLSCSAARSAGAMRVDARACAEAGVDAVDRRVACRRGGDDRGARLHRRLGAAGSTMSFEPPACSACSTSSVSAPGRKSIACPRHRQVEPALARALDRVVVAGVGVGHVAGRWVVPQRTRRMRPAAAVSPRSPQTSRRDAGVLRIAHADAAAVVES